MSTLSNKRVILGVTGGIAAYKAAEIIRLLKKSGAEVRVIMTKSAQEFITPLTLQTLSGNPVSLELLEKESEYSMSHIELAKWSDLILIAPATANTIARLAYGRGDDLLSTVTLAAESKLLIAPAMNQVMWKDKRTQDNIKRLKNREFLILGPSEGEQACGDVGLGRMIEPEEIINSAVTIFPRGELANKDLLITAGPTHEPIDPVRYVTNRSSGKMGYALAQIAYDSGANVTLISGPVSLEAPEGVHIVKVKTSEEMYKAVMHHISKVDIYISAAAVSDFKPKHTNKEKIKKPLQEESLSIDMTLNKDILLEVSKLKDKPYLVGFAAETTDLIKNAKSKLKRKELDLIIANDVSREDVGFDSHDNEVLIINHNKQIMLEKDSKSKIASKIIQFIADEC